MTYCKTAIKLMLFCGLLILASCSNNSDPKVEELPFVTLEAKSGTITGTVNFGSFTYNSTANKLVTLILKNDGTDPLTGPAVLDLSDQGFSITYSNCPASLLKTKSCTLKINFDPRTVASGTKTVNLSFDSVSVSLTAIKESEPVAASPQAQFLMSSVVIDSLDYGTIEKTQSITKTITIKNISSGVITSNLGLSNPNIVLSYDVCSNKPIAKNSSCTIKLTISGSSLIGDVSDTLTYANVFLPIRATRPLVPVVVPNIISLYNSVETSVIDVGSISSSSQVILYFKNTGAGVYSGSAASLDNSNWSLTFSQCTGSLAVNTQCQVRASFSAVGKNDAISYSSVLSLGGKNVALTAKASIPVVCTGNLSQGTLSFDKIDPAVNFSGATTTSAKFVRNAATNKCIISVCDSNYTVASNGLSCSLPQSTYPKVMLVRASDENDGQISPEISINGGQTFSTFSATGLPIGALQNGGYYQGKMVLDSLDTSNNSRQLYLSTNEGSSFSLINLPIEYVNGKSLVSFTGGDMVVQGYTSSWGQLPIKISRDYGNTFSVLSLPGVPDGAFLQSYFRSGNNIVLLENISGNNIVYVSTNGGTLFNPITIPGYAHSNLMTFQENKMVVSGYDSSWNDLPKKISTDFGQTFTDIPMSSFNTSTMPAQNIFFSGNDMFVEVYDTSVSDRRLFKTNDFGETKTEILLPSRLIKNKNVVFFN